MFSTLTELGDPYYYHGRRATAGCAPTPTVRRARTVASRWNAMRGSVSTAPTGRCARSNRGTITRRGSNRSMTLADRIRGLVPVTRQESGWSYNGPLSTTKEWHSAGVGIIAGIATGLSGNPMFLVAVAGFALGRVGDATDAPQHLRDVAREPAYAGGFAALGYALTLLA